MSAKLDDFGDVLTREDLAKLVSYSVRTVRKWEQQERETGIRCLPAEIPGMRHRYTKDAVRRWLKVGVPTLGQRSRKAA
jgi:transposase